MRWIDRSIAFAEDFDRKCTEGEELNFSEEAYKALSESDLYRDFILREVIAHALTLPPSKQFDVNSKFGEPPITLYFSEKNKFVLDLYVWNVIHTAVHEHSFAGAFQVLEGESIENTYKFEPMKTNGLCQTGNLVPLSMKLMLKGETSPIHFGDQLIHRVIHLARPTVSLVLRNFIPPRPQLQYSFKSLASPSTPPESVVLRQRVARYCLEQKIPLSLQEIGDLHWYREFWDNVVQTQSYELEAVKLHLQLFGQNRLHLLKEQFVLAELLNSNLSRSFKIMITALDFYGPQLAWDWSKQILGKPAAKLREEFVAELNSFPGHAALTENTYLATL